MEEVSFGNSNHENGEEEQTSSSKIRGIKDQDKEVYQTILDTLLKAGYFRVRISALSPFDKIVGGLCWCISNSNTFVDVDVSFQEEANIGQKIKVSEKIVRALRRLKCPQHIESFQIQGLDCPVIFQVLKWLVKKVRETRKENQEKIQKYSELVFEKKFSMPTDVVKLQTISSGFPILSEISQQYQQTKRKFKKKKSYLNMSEWSHVQSVLLEYGKDFQLVKHQPSSQQETGETTDSNLEKSVDALDLEQYKRIQELKNELTSENIVENVSAAILSQIVGLRSDDIAKVTLSYQAKSKEFLEQQEGIAGQSEEIMHQRKVNGLKKQVTTVKSEYKELKETHDQCLEKLKQMQEDLNQYQQYNLAIQTKCNDLDLEISHILNGGLAEEQDEEKRREEMATIARLQGLILLNESLKQQEMDFKNNCKKQLKEWNEMIGKLEGMEQNSEEVAQLNQLEKTMEMDSEKLTNVKVLWSKKNREISVIQRKLDDIPQRNELTQYERRFTELYDEILSKLDENKKYFDTYNTLSDTHTYLEKEMSLLNSISEYFQKYLKTKSKEYKQWMVDTVQKIVEAVRANKARATKKLETETSRKDQLYQKYAELVSKQRNYFRGIKEFQEECKINAELKSKLSS